MASFKKIKIPNSEGKNIAAVVHYPETAGEKLAILCPGYLDSKDYPHLVELAQALVSVGYTVVRFDPIGTWESDGTVSDYTTSQYLEDIKSVLEYMLGAGKYAHVLIGGHSRGGMVSLLYGARDPRISTVLGIMPSSARSNLAGGRLEQWEKTGFEISRRDILGTNDKKEFRVPFSHIKDRLQYNTFEDVKKIHVPVILVAGGADIIVLPEAVKQIFDNTNEPKKFILLDGIGHDYRRNLLEIKIVNERVVEALATTGF